MRIGMSFGLKVIINMTRLIVSASFDQLLLKRIAQHRVNEPDMHLLMLCVYLHIANMLVAL